MLRPRAGRRGRRTRRGGGHRHPVGRDHDGVRTPGVSRTNSVSSQSRAGPAGRAVGSHDSHPIRSRCWSAPPAGWPGSATTRRPLSAVRSGSTAAPGSGSGVSWRSSGARWACGTRRRRPLTGSTGMSVARDGPLPADPPAGVAPGCSGSPWRRQPGRPCVAGGSARAGPARAARVDGPARPPPGARPPEPVGPARMPEPAAPSRRSRRAPDQPSGRAGEARCRPRARSGPARPAPPPPPTSPADARPGVGAVGWPVPRSGSSPSGARPDRSR